MKQILIYTWPLLPLDSLLYHLTLPCLPLPLAHGDLALKITCGDISIAPPSSSGTSTSWQAPYLCHMAHAVLHG